MNHSALLLKTLKANGDRYYRVALDGIVIGTRTSNNRDYVAALIVRPNVAVQLRQKLAGMNECLAMANTYRAAMHAGQTGIHTPAEYAEFAVDSDQRAEAYRLQVVAAQAMLDKGLEHQPSVFSYHSRANMAKLPSYCRDGRLEAIAVALFNSPAA